MQPKKAFFLIIILVSVASFIDLPKNFPLKFSLGKFRMEKTLSSPVINLKLGKKEFKRDLEIKKGLDIQGGTHLVLEAEMEKINPNDRKTALESAKSVLARRIDFFGVSEPVIQTSIAQDKYRIIVELPGIKNTSEAIDLIGTVAHLDFRELPKVEEEDASPSAMTIFDFAPTDLTGKDLAKAFVQFEPQTGKPTVGLNFTTQGGKKFAEITQRNTGKQVGIFLDGLPITIPTVNEPITSGKAIISGNFTLDQAKTLVIQLNAGALPVPIKVVEQKTIGATLGAESVVKSIKAGLIGLGLVMLFMFVFYGFPGFLADIALVIYGLVTLAIYKLIPVTLTLPGLAGFILSVGMAVDSNILIFERMKEEIGMGKPFKIALELGFGRAWDSIKDANVCTLITCFILFNPFNWNFLNTSGMIKGFALTLFLGIAVSLFTGIIVTRTLLRLFYRERKK